MSVESPILDRLLELRSKASESGVRAPAGDIYGTLRRDFDVAVIRATVVACLHECADVEWQDQNLDARQRFLVGTCFELAAACEELTLELDDVKVLVRKFDTIGWPRSLSHWVALRLRDVDLLETLTTGIREASSDWMRSSCLDGIAAYFGYTKRPSDPSVLEPPLLALEAELRRLRTAKDSMLAECVEGARRMAWSIRRTNPGLPRPSAADYKACRAARPGGVDYRIERACDGDLAVNILNVTTRERVLVIEFDPLDPALLPEDTPAVIEDVLLRRHAVGAFAEVVDEVEYVNSIRHGAVTRRPPVRA